MLNRLISLVFLLSFFKISIVYAETNFLLPQKKPSIFKKSEKQIQESIDKNLPAPKPLLEKKGETKPAVVEQKKEPDKKKEIKIELQKQLKGLGSVVDATALRSYLLKNGKIKSITGDRIILDTPSNNSSFSKQDDTADQVSKMASQSAKSSIDK